MKRKKILHVIAGMNRCGAETFLMNVFRNIDREKYEFYFLCYGDNTYEYEEEIAKLNGFIIRMQPLKKVGIKEFCKKLTDIMKKYEFDIIHTHTYYNGAIPLYIAKRNGIQIRIAHSHNTKSEYKTPLRKKMYNIMSKILIDKCANVFLACSNKAGEALFFKNRKFKVINNGINLEKFKFNQEKRVEVRKKLNIENDEIVIGHIGRFETQKNHIFLIQILNQILKIKDNYKLLLLGNGSKFQEIKDICKNLNIEHKVIFLGNIQEVYDVINAFDIFVFPSLFEGLGIVLIEAQANGIKCFASTEVPKEANISNNIQYIELSEGIEKWTKKIVHTKIERKEMDLTNCEYDIKNTVKQLVEVYDK